MVPKYYLRGSSSAPTKLWRNTWLITNDLHGRDAGTLNGPSCWLEVFSVKLEIRYFSYYSCQKGVIVPLLSWEETLDWLLMIYMEGMLAPLPGPSTDWKFCQSSQNIKRICCQQYRTWLLNQIVVHYWLRIEKWAAQFLRHYCENSAQLKRN